MVCLDGTILNKKMFKSKNWVHSNENLGIIGSSKIPTTEVTFAITQYSCLSC